MAKGQIAPHSDLAEGYLSRLKEISTTKRTPSAIEWLAEKRARIAFDLDTKPKILRDLETQIADLQVDLAALDRSITINDRRVNPSGIEPVNVWKGSYGKRGALKEAMKGFIQEALPNAITCSPAGPSWLGRRRTAVGTS